MVAEEGLPSAHAHLKEGPRHREASESGEGGVSPQRSASSASICDMRLVKASLTVAEAGTTAAAVTASSGASKEQLRNAARVQMGCAKFQEMLHTAPPSVPTLWEPKESF